MFLSVLCVYPFSMRLVNVEIKARCSEPAKIRGILQAKGARFAGTDHQVDTYFRVPTGRLKLREGNIENALIFYRRPDEQGPKASDVTLCPVAPASSLKQLLREALGVLVTVNKQREIYFIENVKFHIDRVEGLGSFVEIEASGEEGTDRSALLRQCRSYMKLFGIAASDLVSGSYSDLLCHA